MIGFPPFKKTIHDYILTFVKEFTQRAHNVEITSIERQAYGLFQHCVPAAHALKENENIVRGVSTEILVV